MTNDQNTAEKILSYGKNFIYHFLGYLQYFVALTIIVAILITLLSIPQQLGVLTDVGSESLISFLEYVINVIISIELIHVLLHQTLDSIVEVLSLAITRELILQHLHTWEFLIGVIAVAVLFAIRKYLFISKKDKPLSKSEDKAVTIDEDGIHAPKPKPITAGLYGYRPGAKKEVSAAAAPTVTESAEAEPTDADTETTEAGDSTETVSEPTAAE